MIEATQGTVQAAEGCINLWVEPPRRSSLADPPGPDGVCEILFTTGINMGPVDVGVEYFSSPRQDHPDEEFEEIWEALELELPVGRIYLNGPGTWEVMELGTVDRAAEYTFIVYGSGRFRMPDLVTDVVVETYLVWVWPSEPG